MSEQTKENPLGMKSIGEMQKQGFAQIYKQRFSDAIKLDWYFSGWEKLIIIGCFLWTVFSIGKFIYGLL